MTRSRSIPVLILLLGALAVPHAAPSRAPAAADAVIEFNNNHVIVPVDWQGRRLWFVLDTGAPNSFLDLGTAKAAGVALGSSINATGAGAGSTAGAVLQEPVIVSIAATPVPIDVTIRAALDFKDLSAHAGRDLSGIIGADVIRQWALEIDYEHGHLRFHDEQPFEYVGPGATVPLTFKGAFPMVRATLFLDAKNDRDSFDAQAILDVGASSAVVVTQPIAVARHLAERLHAGEVQPTGRGVGGAAMGRLARLPSLTIGGAKGTNLVAVLSEANAGVMSTTNVFEINVGGGFMRHFTMFFDYKRSRVTFEPNGQFAEPFDGDMSGLILTSAGASHERVIVETVRRGSPAADAGIQDGDRIVTIDGEDAGGMTLERLRKLFRIDQHAYALVVEHDGRTRNVTLTTRRLI
jgi:hypothetical protein